MSERNKNYQQIMSNELLHHAYLSLQNCVVDLILKKFSIKRFWLNICDLSFKGRLGTGRFVLLQVMLTQARDESELLQRFFIKELNFHNLYHEKQFNS